MSVQQLGQECQELLRVGDFAAALATCERVLAGNLTNADRVRALMWKVRTLVTRDATWSGPAMEALKTALRLARRN